MGCPIFTIKSDELPLLTSEYWKSLENILTNYVMHDKGKFDYDNSGKAHLKHLSVGSIRYIGRNLIILMK